MKAETVNKVVEPFNKYIDKHNDSKNPIVLMLVWGCCFIVAIIVY